MTQKSKAVLDWLLRAGFLTLFLSFVNLASVKLSGVGLSDWWDYGRAENSLCTRWGGMQAHSTMFRTLRAYEDLSPNLTLVRTDQQGYRLWRTPEWEYWTPPNTERFGAGFVVAQWRVPAYTGAPIRNGDIVVDGGGFVGDYAKWALAQGASKVVVVEPAPEALECIRRNLKSELASGQVMLYEKGLWDKNDKLFLEVPSEDNPAANRIAEGPSGKRGVWVDLTTLDQMADDLKLDRVDVLKLDIEGAESKAVAGAAKFLRRFRPRVAIATEHTDDQLRNNRETIAAMAATAPFYKRYECEYCVVLDRKVVPQTLFFLEDGQQ